VKLCLVFFLSFFLSFSLRALSRARRVFFSSFVPLKIVNAFVVK
jgi:hypothetical protein